MKHVYGMKRTDGAIKVGISADPQKRRMSVGQAIRQQVDLMFIIPSRSDARRVEEVAHKLLQTKHADGEWFLVSVQEAMDAVSHAVEIVEGQAPDITSKIHAISGPGKKTEYPDDLFVRMPPETKEMLELLSGASPAPSAWVRQLIVDAIKREAERQGVTRPYPKESN